MSSISGGLAGPPPSALRQAPGAGERAAGLLARLVPDRVALVDAAFAVVLMGIALIGFRTTFHGLGWLWVGLAGLLVGVLVSHVGATYRWYGLGTGLALAVGYFLLAGPVAVREDLIGGVLPSGEALATLAHAAVPGWKELLTALPPVDSEGPYLALPFLFGLVGGALTYGVARRWTGALVVLAPAVGLLVASIVLGTLTPAAVAVQGAVFALVAIGWAALRSNRNRPTLQNGAGRTTRAVTTAVLLAAATAGGFLLGPHLPGADDTHRTVLRTSLVPPYDVTKYPSPLAGFRQYTEPNPAKLFDRTLLTVQGLPPGVPLRFAALDSYDSFVWGAGNVANLGDGPDAGGASFRKVGSHIASDGPGEAVTATVTVPADGYADVWLPTFGTVTGLTFGGDRADALSEELRLNTDTGTGVLPTRLAAGDTYTITARVSPVPDVLPEHVDVDGGSVVDTQALTFLDERVDAWTGRVDSPWQKVTAMAKALQSGAYTDGGAAGDAVQNVFLPGHSLRRMTQFVKATQLAGNDEQYASALALAANRLGVPARVVLGAVPDATGAVKGKDVHAWVEVRRADGEWQPILPSQFLPDRNKKPEPLIQKSEQQKTGAQVPPPAANNPPSVLQGPDQAQNATQLRTPPKDEDSPFDPDTWPDWLRYLIFFVAIPLLLALLVHGSIRLAKAVRRRRRRRTGGPSARVTGGWREVVDTARDLRMPLPVKGTRLEQARALEAAQTAHSTEAGAPTSSSSVHFPPAHTAHSTEAGAATSSSSVHFAQGSGLALATLAATANHHVFDIAEPTPEEVEAFWADVATARRALRAGHGFWARLRADLSLRTFRTHLPTGHGLGPSRKRTSRSDDREPSGIRPNRLKRKGTR
ncbi:transglutaminase domain-containing protein [Intrasporangium sp.]|uniref:transglutaminase domain-containing protein n=1 Tax=Intrasporangium sp. TaxID=1925024 RepID=UPI0033653AF2